MTTRTLSLPRRLPRPHLRVALGVPGPVARRRLAVLVGLAVLLGAGFLVVRESSLVAVTDVTITGPTGTTAGPVRSALTGAAEDMTTLSYDRAALLTAVAPYPIVKDVRVEVAVPHGMEITVVEHEPVASVRADGRMVPVAADGTILRGVDPGALPELPVRTPPAGARLTDAGALRLARVLGTAPAPLLAKVQGVRVSAGRGVEIGLSAGPLLIIGTAERLDAKWSAAARVLADPSARGATYVDVRLPERPAAGGLEQAAVQQQQTEAGGTTATPDDPAAPVDPPAAP